MTKPFAFLGLALLPLAAGCTSQSQFERSDNHWSQWSIGPSIERHFLGWDRKYQDDYVEDVLEQDARSVSVMLERYFMHSNPDNPFQNHGTARAVPAPVK